MTASIILGHPTTSGPTLPPIVDGKKRTVIFVHKQTQNGQDLFIRGGIGGDQRPGNLIYFW